MINKYKAVRAVSVLVFTAALFRWGYVRLQYADAELSYKQLAQNVVSISVPEEREEQRSAEADNAESLIKIDHETLRAENHDYIGWLYACGGKISYPVVQSSGNDIYLHRTFFGDSSFVGSIFADYRSDGGFGDFQTVLYGHSMKDGSMFRLLVPYTDKTYAEQYPYFYIFTDTGIQKYEIFSVCLEDGSKVTAVFGDVADEEKQSILNELNRNSLYKISDIQPGTESSIVTLVTCDVRDDSKRVVVSGVRLPSAISELK